MENTQAVQFGSALLKKLRPNVATNRNTPIDVDIAGTNTDLSKVAPAQKEGYLNQAGMNVANNRAAFEKQAPALSPTTAIKAFSNPVKGVTTEPKISATGVVTETKPMVSSLGVLPGTPTEKTKSTSTLADKGIYGANLINMSEDNLTKSTLKMEQEQKDREVGANVSDRDRTLKAGEESLSAFKNLIGLDSQGNVDMTKSGSIGASLQKDFNNYQTEQNKLNTQYESARRGRVVGQMRANLLARGIDISKLPQEKLIALSDEVGAKAFGDIYENKERVINNINTKQEALTGKLNELRDKGVLAEDKYRTLTATVNSQFEKTKNDILDRYKDTVLGVVQTGKQRDEATKTGAINTLESLLSKAMPEDVPLLRQKYMAQIASGKLSTSDLVASMSKDSRFKASVKALADNAQKVAAQKAALEQAKINAEIAAKQATAAKALRPTSSSSSSGAKAKTPSMPSISDIKEASSLGIQSKGLTKSQLTQKVSEVLSK